MPANRKPSERSSSLGEFWLPFHSASLCDKLLIPQINSRFLQDYHRYSRCRGELRSEKQ